MSSGRIEWSRQNLYRQRKFSDGSEVIFKTYVLYSTRCSTVTKIRNSRNKKRDPFAAHTPTQPHTLPHTHKHTLKHTHEHTHTHTFPSLRSPLPLPPHGKKTTCWVTLGVPYKKKAPETCAKGRTCTKCLWHALWELQKWPVEKTTSTVPFVHALRKKGLSACRRSVLAGTGFCTLLSG